MGKLNKELRKRFIELAAMFKEKIKGTEIEAEEIIHRFVLQEGVRLRIVREYIEALEGAGLLIFSKGHKRWHYNPDAEWDLFKINI